MTGSGKTQLTKQLLEKRGEVFDNRINRILWCYTEHQPALVKELKETIPDIEFHEGLPEELENPEPDKHMILVLDDLIHECKNSKLQKVFVRGSHHQKITVIYLTQNAFEPGQRTISMQCKYVVLMRNPRDCAHYQYLGRAMNGGKNCPVLEAAYKDISNKPYGYVVLDFSQNQNNDYRIRNSLFFDDMIVYSKLK